MFQLAELGTRDQFSDWAGLHKESIIAHVTKIESLPATNADLNLLQVDAAMFKVYVKVNLGMGATTSPINMMQVAVAILLSQLIHTESPNEVCL